MCWYKIKVHRVLRFFSQFSFIYASRFEPDSQFLGVKKPGSTPKSMSVEKVTESGPVTCRKYQRTMLGGLFFSWWDCSKSAINHRVQTRVRKWCWWPKRRETLFEVRWSMARCSDLHSSALELAAGEPIDQAWKVTFSVDIGSCAWGNEVGRNLTWQTSSTCLGDWKYLHDCGLKVPAAITTSACVVGSVRVKREKNSKAWPLKKLSPF